MTKTIAVLPKLETLAGPASFYGRFTKTAREKGYTIHNDPADPEVDALLVIAGSRHLGQLWRAKRRGVRIVQRIDGLNWHHKHMKTGVYHYIRSEINNLIMQIIRKYLADELIYQSIFAKDWWETVYGPVSTPHNIMFNGIDLDEFSPEGKGTPPDDHIRMLVLEGRMGGGQEKGLDNAVRITQMLNDKTPNRVELMVVGQVDEKTKAYWEKNANTWITWKGQIPRNEVPVMDRSAHLMFSADLNGSCPNAVVEALACGLPVASFATGAIPEMITGKSGYVAPYGTNFWKCETPIFEPIIPMIEEIIANQSEFRSGARKRAEEAFDLRMVSDFYLGVLFPSDVEESVTS